MNDLKRMIDQMVAGARADTDSMFDSYRRNLEQLDRDLASAEALFMQGIQAIKAQRQRIYSVVEPTPAELTHRKPEPVPRVVTQGPRKEQSNG